MENEKMLSAIRNIERAFGKIEGVAFVLDRIYSTPLFDALELLECAIKEITDGK